MMRLIAFLAGLLIGPALADPAPKWQRATEIYTRSGNAFLRGTVFFNTYTGVMPAGCTAHMWCTIDLSSEVAEDATAAFLSGILIITHGQSQETADLKLGFRAFGDNEGCPVPQTPGCVWYAGQTIETATDGGQRSNMSAWVPLKSGKFQVWFGPSSNGQWPAMTSYGVNLSLQAWVR